MASSSAIIPEISRSLFPEDFVFGCSTAAYQIEGAAAEGGRTASMWDVYSMQKPSNIVDGSNGTVAADHYHRYKEDVAIMKKMGLEAHRFSISWTRVLPGGRLSGGINKEGIQFYNNLIDELLANGIQPYVTLFHWDTPQALELEYGGFLDRKIVDDFREFADLCFWEFGDRVKHWITFNTPYSYAVGGYCGGSMAPGRGGSGALGAGRDAKKNQVPLDRSGAFFFGEESEFTGDPGTEPYIVAHNMLLAHAEAVKLFRSSYQAQGGQIGIILMSLWWEPMSSSAADKKACERSVDFFFGWFMEPITFGDYPQIMVQMVDDRLPVFSEDEKASLKGSYDFLGLNYYTARYAEDSTQKPSTASYLSDSMVTSSVTGPDGNDIGERAASIWLYMYPAGMYKILKYIKERYQDPVIYITENGYDDETDHNLTIAEARKDEKRIKCHQDHIKYMWKAMETDGVQVKGYFAWTLLDDYEWTVGYTVRFGMIYVDFNTLVRYPKWSALWYMNFLKGSSDGFINGEAVKEPIITGGKRALLASINVGAESASQRAPKRKSIYRSSNNGLTGW